MFVAFFPHLVAGPILRASSLLPQIDSPRRITPRADAGRRVADRLGLLPEDLRRRQPRRRWSTRVFDPGAPQTGVNVLLGVYAFAFQIYGDFAGYSNIARGTSKLMGIELIENFRFPYLVRTPQAFWRNWHISLSTWLRDYLYIPLGGSRGSEWQTRRNLLITMVLGGLWHGAAWTFVLWGIYHGLLLIAYRAAERAGVAPSGGCRRRTRSARIVSWAVMFHLTCYGWLIFRARSAGQIRRSHDTAWSPTSRPTTVNVNGLLVPLLLYTTPLLVVHACEAWFDDGLVVPRLPVGVRYSIYAATCYLTLLFGNFGGAEFIYFQF